MLKRNLGLIGFLILLMASSACATASVVPQTSAPTSQASASTAATQSDASKPKEQKQQPTATAQPNTPSSAAAAKPKDQKGQPGTAPSNNPDFIAAEILGRPTNASVTVNVVPSKNMEIYYEYGTASGNYANQTAEVTAAAGTPVESVIDKLAPNSRYYYRIRYGQPGTGQFVAGPEHTFVTQRAPGSTFTFDLQGDSHPERPQQNDPELYKRTLLSAASDQPDFFMTIGDDFSVDNLKTVNVDTVTERYNLQREFLGLVGNSAPIFLVNGNHEQAAQYNLNGTPNNVAVWAQQARNRYFPQPAPDNFYTGDTQPVEFIGLLRDYYAWTWGDALFIVIDPYWHSSVPVDSVFGGASKQRDMWGITLGDAQYQWFKKTLEQSNAKYKFVFAHHVLGTGRGGIELAGEYEWGGKGRNGVWEFDKMRPGWELPIHQLMVKNGVSIFFQGHDHIFVRQELDGIIYQELPEPADPGYVAYNEDAYKSGVKLPNIGHLRVTVSPAQVKVDYVRSYLPKDEINGRKSGEIAYSYTVAPKVK
jgi:hypothetical protein